VTVLDAADKQVRHSNTDMSISSSFSNVDWTRDSRTLLFVNAERMNIWKQPALGGRREKLTNYSDLWVMRFSVSPDGKSLLLCRGVVVRDAVLMTNFR
jgi:Tol biopolymer transport system component